TAYRGCPFRPAAVGPADNRAGQGLPGDDQRQPTGPARDGQDGVQSSDSRDGGCDLSGEKRGCVVTRRLWVDTEVADYAREQLNYPGVRILARVDCERRQGGQVLSVETRYFATSLDPERVAVWELLKLIRGHWGVENSLHHIKDRWWDEDRHYTKEPAKGEG